MGPECQVVKVCTNRNMQRLPQIRAVATSSLIVKVIFIIQVIRYL